MKKIRVRHVPRERDEEVLRWMHMRLTLGMSWAEIARVEGVGNYQAIQTAVRAITHEMEADHA